jgi:hypothetical protein
MRRLSAILILLTALLLTTSPAWAHHKPDHYPPGCQPGFSEGKSAEAPGCQKHQPTSLTRELGEGAGGEPTGITVGMLTAAAVGGFTVFYVMRQRRRFQAQRI